MLKNRFDMQLDEITKTTEQKVMALKQACDEVMSFQKFYKGVGATDEEVCMYMTDIQVEELMETEEMLERYSQYYQQLHNVLYFFLMRISIETDGLK